MCNLKNDGNAIIKPVDKGRSTVVWDKRHYLADAEKQLSDSHLFKKLKLSEKKQLKLVEKSNSMF